MMWKDFFYFTKTERQGIIILVALIVCVFSISKLLQVFSSPPEVSREEEEQFRQEYDAFIASIQETKPRRKFSKDSPRMYPSGEISLSMFDPNTADSMTFLSLGLPPWMAGNILHYRRKQGRFRQPEDFRKIYGLTEEQYQTLLPYIRITAHSVPKDTTRLIVEQRVQKDTLFKYQPGTVVCLNTADTTELMKIPGIGSTIARMIVNYRSRLGGFHRIEQLEEARLKAEMLRPWFSVDATHIRRINVNKASIERMMNHPYISYYQAKVIVEYRKKKGNLKDIKQLSLYEEFTPVDIEQMAPYICYN